MSAKVKLTREQRAKVRSLMEDEGWGRAEAVAWVRRFESGGDPPPLRLYPGGGA